MGVPLDRMVIWDPHELYGGLTPSRPPTRAADSVEGPLLGPHAVHRRADRGVPEEASEGKVIAHPEVHVRRRAGRRRSGLDRIHHRNTVQRAPRDRSGPLAPRSTWSIAWRTSSRPTARSMTLDPFGCLCSTMFRVSPNHLLWILEGLLEGTVHNQIIVPGSRQKRWAHVALDRMLAIH